MLSPECKSKLINEILKSIDKNGSVNVPSLSEKYEITTKSVYKHLEGLIKRDEIERISKSKYKICSKLFTFEFDNINLSEDAIWKLNIQPNLPQMTKEAHRALNHIFTEMFNNAIDHSQGTQIVVTMKISAVSVFITIADNGIGIFENINNVLNLGDEKYAILELIKGKFTSDPKRHSGEGIFFSSKMANTFVIHSKGIFYTFKSDKILRFDDTKDFLSGTAIHFSVDCDSNINLFELFQKYNSQFPEDAGFTATTIPVKLLGYGDNETSFISRSQAKRLLVRFDKFDNVILDFEGVDFIGQGFADEVFRVFNIDFPQVTLKPVNCNDEVQRMIAHVKNKR